MTEESRAEPDRCDISVVIGTYNRGRFLRATLESIREELGDEPHEIIVVDGGSTDGTLRWLVEQRDVITIVQHNRGERRGRPIERRSWGYFMNLGFKAAQGRLVCMLSDDCLVVPGAIRNGRAAFDERLRDGRIGAAAFYWRDWPHERDYKVGVTFGDRLFVNHGLYLRSALAEVGYVDEDHFSFYHADGDLALRLDRAGYACVEAPNSYIEHYSDANQAVRASNLVRQLDDHKRYETRWAHLGERSREWETKPYVDPYNTVRAYWGRLLTNRILRLVKVLAFRGRTRLREALVQRRRTLPS